MGQGWVCKTEPVQDSLSEYSICLRTRSCISMQRKDDHSNVVTFSRQSEMCKQPQITHLSLEGSFFSSSSSCALFWSVIMSETSLRARSVIDTIFWIDWSSSSEG